MSEQPTKRPIKRCWWAGEDPLYVAYHDREWGFPVSDDRRLFEKICLEGFQAGLSWRTILGKREAFRVGFANFEFELVDEFGSLAAYFWRFEPAVSSRPKRLTREVLSGMPTSTESIALSKDLKRRGWTFVGPTTVYAFMQAMGLVNDHVHDCATRAPAQEARAAFTPPR